MSIIKSHGAPTVLTVGEVNQKYIDLDTDTKYKCVGINRIETYKNGPCIHNSFVTTRTLKEVHNEYIWEDLSGCAISWDDLNDKPFNSYTGKVDIFPEQEVTFTNGSAKLVDGKDPCYELNLVSDPGTMDAFLEVNGEIIEGQISYHVVLNGTFGAYSINIDTLTMSDGSSVQDGETVTVRLYAIAEIVNTLNPKYLPDQGVVLTRKQSLTEQEKNQARLNIGALGYGDRFKRYELFTGIHKNLTEGAWTGTLTLPDGLYAYKEIVVQGKAYMPTSVGTNLDIGISVTLRDVNANVNVSGDAVANTKDGFATMNVSIQRGSIIISTIKPSGQDAEVPVYLYNIYAYSY